MNGVTALSQISENMSARRWHSSDALACVAMTTKKGDSMLVAMLEDLESSIELVAFPKSCEKYRELLQEDALLRVTAKVDKSRRDESLQLMLENAAALDPAAGISTGAGAPTHAPEPPPCRWIWRVRAMMFPPIPAPRL